LAQPFFDLQGLLGWGVVIVASLIYVWFYEGWLSDSDVPGDDPRSFFKLTRPGERLRWFAAFVAILVILLEVSLNRVRSWGVCIALLISARAYLRDNFVTTQFGGGFELSPRQQASRRRYALLPACLFLLRGTDFQYGSILHGAILVMAAVVFLTLVLVPEPAE
jgi:hypothetical protein